MTWHVDGFRKLDPVVEDGHHQLAVVLHDRRLAGEERVAIWPNRGRCECRDCRSCALVCGARVVCNIQARDADRARCARHFHQLNSERSPVASCAVHAPSLRSQHNRRRSPLPAHRGSARCGRQRCVLPSEDRWFRNQSERACARRSWIQVADDDHGGAQKDGGGGAASPTGPAPAT